MSESDFTPAQLAELTAKIASAKVAIRQGDKSIQFADLEAMIALRDRMRREIAGTSAARPSRHLAKFTRGDR